MDGNSSHSTSAWLWPSSQIHRRSYDNYEDRNDTTLPSSPPPRLTVWSLCWRSVVIVLAPLYKLKIYQLHPDDTIVINMATSHFQKILRVCQIISVNSFKSKK